jgi:alpha-amylase/alpha-mannosidase (GH57 family)
MILLLLLSSTIYIGFYRADSREAEPLYLIIIWHYHQPWYYDVTGGSLVLPWVRMHSVGNYYKMAYILSKYPDVKVSFTFSGSLLAQLKAYVDGNVTDLRQQLSWKIARGDSLSVDERFSMLQIPGGFFDINWNRIVNVVPKYRELRDKALEAFKKHVGLPEERFKEAVVGEFTEQDILDLACLFNLFWVDPLVLREVYPELYKVREGYLRDRDYRCSRDVLRAVLEAHNSIMAKTIPAYRELLERGQVEIVPVPYSHPLAPLLTASGMEEDLELHVNLSLNFFREVFNYSPKGIWPAELAVNEDVFRVFSKLGLSWSIADDTVLSKSAPTLKTSHVSGVTVAESYFWVLDFNGSPFYVLFRNSDLSNLISFTYSTLPYTSAVSDLMSKLRSIASALPGGVIVIALDGENPWEHYEEFGDLFLLELYKQLSQAQKEGVIRTITPSEYIAMKRGYARELPALEHRYLNLKSKDISDIPISYSEDAYTILPREPRRARIAEGSWAGGELAIWIGQRQENAAWMLMVKSREDVLRAIGVTSLKEAFHLNPKAVMYILMAEASDWLWWYGGDGGGVFPSNVLFKQYLRKAYDAVALRAPHFLEALFNPDATPVGVLNTDVPKPVDAEPRLDGVLDEPLWGNSLRINVGERYVREALVAVSPQNLIIGLKLAGVDGTGLRLAVYLTNPWRSVSPHDPGYNSFFRDGSIAPMGLFYEILVDLRDVRASVNVADGRGGWVKLFNVNSIAVGGSVELLIPWSMLSLSPGDIVYVVVAVYSGGVLVERSDRVGLTHVIHVPRAAVAPQARVVFEMVDPEGDDDGAGGYRYPLNPVFKPGVFDLLKFTVSVTGDKVVFSVYVKSLGGNPWGGPNGFSLQYVHIYIRTTLGERGRGDTLGLNVNLSDDSRWHVAILIAPGWGSDPVPKGERAAIYYANGTTVVQDALYKVYADPVADAIVAEVSKTLLPDVDNIERWVYTVFLTSYDGYGPDRIRPFGVESQEWVVGAGAKYAQAILFNVIPRVMDLLAPTKDEQYAMLNTFKVDRERGVAQMAVVKGVSKTAVTQPPTKTVTVTEVVERSVTSIVERLVEKPITITEVQTRTSRLLLALLAGLGLGLILSVLMLRRR